MKKSVISIFLVLVLFSAAAAQYSAQLSPATTVMKGNSKAGAYFGVYDGAFGLVGQYRYGVGGYTDIGVKAAVVDLDANSPEGDVGFSLAFDTKYQIMEVRIMDPIDMSIGGSFELAKFNHFSNFIVGGTFIGAYPVQLKNGRMLTPYGRLILGFERSKLSGARSETDFNLALNLGTSIELSTSTDALAEIQLDNDYAAFLMGLTFGL